jgi:hypothetical protein
MGLPQAAGVAAIGARAWYVSRQARLRRAAGERDFAAELSLTSEPSLDTEFDDAVRRLTEVSSPTP